MSGTETMSIVLVGVGGQGILLASDIAAGAAMAAGYQVKTNEVHGMAQRGGSVVAQIRYGREVHSPLVPMGTAKVLGALEQIEALRFADYLEPNGLAVVSTQAIVPVTVSMGAAKYPTDIDVRLKTAFAKLKVIDAAEVAVKLGDIRASNVVILGALSKGLDLPIDAWHASIKKFVKSHHQEMNMKAFEAGRSLA